MEAEFQQSKGRKGAILALDAAIEALNLARDLSSIIPARAVFCTVGVVLTTIKDAMINQVEYVELGLACAGVCTALNRGLDGKGLKDLNNSVCEVIKELTTAVTEIQRKIVKQGKRNVISRHLHARKNKEKIVAWRLDLMRILHVFNTELAIKTHVTVSNICCTIVQGQEGGGGENLLTQTSILGESPPLPPRTFFGRDELIGKIVDLAERIIPIALIASAKPPPSGSATRA